jgi:hypothetical protein
MLDNHVDLLRISFFSLIKIIKRFLKLSIAQNGINANTERISLEYKTSSPAKRIIIHFEKIKKNKPIINVPINPLKK